MVMASMIRICLYFNSQPLRGWTRATLRLVYDNRSNFNSQPLRGWTRVRGDGEISRHEILIHNRYAAEHSVRGWTGYAGRNILIHNRYAAEHSSDIFQTVSWSNFNSQPLRGWTHVSESDRTAFRGILIHNRYAAEHEIYFSGIAGGKIF